MLYCRTSCFDFGGGSGGRGVGWGGGPRGGGGEDDERREMVFDLFGGPFGEPRQHVELAQDLCVENVGARSTLLGLEEPPVQEVLDGARIAINSLCCWLGGCLK